mmetsp:Transcript_16761/g.50746  ORF Transcript_16761/g.50746 Transcript_16761/m.50746 type:complete len:302 (-) Transcript_16761:436-1341(-)
MRKHPQQQDAEVEEGEYLLHQGVKCRRHALEALGREQSPRVGHSPAQARRARVNGQGARQGQLGYALQDELEDWRVEQVERAGVQLRRGAPLALKAHRVWGAVRRDEFETEVEEPNQRAAQRRPERHERQEEQVDGGREQQQTGARERPPHLLLVVVWREDVAVENGIDQRPVPPEGDSGVHGRFTQKRKLDRLVDGAGHEAAGSPHLRLADLGDRGRPARLALEENRALHHRERLEELDPEDLCAVRPRLKLFGICGAAALAPLAHDEGTHRDHGDVAQGLAGRVAEERRHQGDGGVELV